MDPDKIHSLGCDLSDDRTKEALEKITSLKSLASPVVCLPDLHIKHRTEGPSSFVAATEGTIVPELTAPSVGCGMGVLATDLNAKDIDHVFFEKFFHEVRQNLGPRYGHFKNMLLWIGFIKRPKNKYDLSIEEFENIIKYGAKAAIEKYNLPQDAINNIEYNGTLFTKKEIDSLDLKKILPRISYRSGRHDIGYGFKGNHFLEIQYIDEILDKPFAEKWGLKENQIIIMYHGGGGAISYHVGRYFGNRRKNTRFQKLVLSIFKTLFHFSSLKDLNHFIKRLRYYFFPKSFLEIPIDSKEGQRLMLATKASLNYSYGFRMAMAKRIMDSIGEALPDRKTEIKLVWDSCHNSIVEEKIKGEKVIVHRHTANRVFANKPIIISGFNTTNSYLAVGLKNAENTLFSSDHGAGVTIQKLEQEGLSKTHPKKYTTHIYQTKTPFKRIVHHITNEGINKVMNILEKEQILKPVAKLKPLAVFKG
ncbi:RtcB family protein [Patescibacteria group bacterium]